MQVDPRKTIRPTFSRHGLRWLAAICMALVVAPAAADSLTPMRSVALPAIEATGRIDGIAAIDGQAVAILENTAWRLDDKGNAWRPIAWKSGTAPGDIAALFGDGKRTYALIGASRSGAIASVARVQLAGSELSLQPLPPLPVPLSAVQGALSGNVIYLTGQSGSKIQLLQMMLDAERPTWSTVDGWPQAVPATSLVVQTAGVFATVPDATDGHERLWRWSASTGWVARGVVPGVVVPGTGRAMGQAHVLYLVRDAANAPVRAMTFQTITGSWATLPGVSIGNPLASASWQDGLLWAAPNADGKRIEFASAQVQSSKLLLRWLDWIVIVVYLSAMIGIGLYFYLREKRGSTSSFFVGGRSIPFWAAGVSLYAANTSSISFIAIPAKAFESNWQYLTNNLIAVFGLMFVAVWIVPLLRRLDLMSVFSYLETRFHPAIRMLASALCILTQIGSRMSVILFLPALAIATITGISVTWSVILMGGFTIIYTAMGGMKAVIWTDFVQVIVKMGGAIFAIGFIVWSLHGGVGEFMATAMAENKMHVFDFSFDLTKATVWGFLFLVLFDVVLTFPKDQVLMQRTLSTKSDKEAGRSIWAFAAIMIPGGFVFYLIGTALFVFYKAHPERMNPLLPIDATFPLFIAAELPMGVTGLIVAGIFAAAMATLSGIMNSVATLISVDFYDKLVKDPSQKKSVFFAEMMTVVVGLIGIGAALLLSRFDVHSLFDVSIELAGLLGGGFAGAYTLGMFTRRANAPGVAIGIASSICLTLIAWTFHLVHPYFYLAISILLCIVIGYVASLFFPAPTRSLKGLTIYADVEE
ncbi:SSS family transporter [Luteibacter rhizovicinus]|uniref:SSS family transporter n=1 Tax=Luteibacter rhizovicinus TaxID=242606 RepID=A0A4R3YKF9_9GAMM|nr:sodium:solute symporter [Luteibacter rhizovicinus]TCV92730.1 SSS family transporter [Luteibacter rhizovicinus]